MSVTFPTSFGMEISKNDLDRMPDNVLAKLVLDHKFILVRSLFLSPDQLIHYGQKFGKLYLSSKDLRGNGEHRWIKSKEHKEISVVSREGMHKNTLIGWHIDLLHKPSRILTGRILYADKTEVESLTSWSDTVTACNLVDKEIMTFAEQALCFYSAPYNTKWAGTVRPMVKKHPKTGDRALMVDKLFTNCIIGESYEYTENFKDAALSKILVDDNVYAHHWRKGDLIIYDNNSTMHQREKITSPAQGERTLWRLTFDFV